MKPRSRSSWYRFSQGHPVWNSLVRASRPEMKQKRGSGKSLAEHPLSHLTLHPGCNQNTLCFWHFHTSSVWVAPVTLQCQVCEEPTRWHVTVHDGMPFPDGQWPCTVSCWMNISKMENTVFPSQYWCKGVKISISSSIGHVNHLNYPL